MTHPPHELDYQQTVAIWANLVDVRFRLLALVPALSAAGIGLLGQVDRLASLRVALVAVLGLATVVALCMYDLRNSIFHDFAVHRAKVIEKRLQLERTTRIVDKASRHPRPLRPNEVLGGIFEERPRFKARLLGAEVWHDRALTVAYTASAGAWAALAAYSLAARLGPSDWDSTDYVWIAAGASLAVAAALWFGIWWYDCRVAYFKHALTSGSDKQASWEAHQGNRPCDKLVARWLNEASKATGAADQEADPEPDRGHPSPGHAPVR